MAIKSQYVKPYFDSAVFISWLKDTDVGPSAPNGDDQIDRHPISERVIVQAEDGIYPIVTSYLTMAEVFKKKGDGNQPLSDTQNGKIVKYFENEWIEWVPLERLIGEDANALLVKYRAAKLRPFDAIHLASALRAKCDVLLTWDGPLAAINHPDIRIEFPEVFTPPSFAVQTTLFSGGELIESSTSHGMGANSGQKESL